MADQAKQLMAQGIILQPSIGVRELCRRSFWRFLRHFWPSVSSDEFRPNWHIEFLCSELQQMAERVSMKIPRKHDLIVNVPPGTTKTITCSVMFPVWCWTRWHWMKFITASYSSILSLESADLSRDLMRSQAFRDMYPEISIKRDKEGKSNYRVVKSEGSKAILGGGRLSTSVGGSVTGFHGHMLIVDDPLNPLQAASDLELANASHWFDHTFSTRKTDKKVSPTIIIMQRLHQADPTGHMLEKRNIGIRHVCLPGEINTPGYREKVNPPELADRYVDGLLDPARMDAAVLADLEERLGQFGYASQIGQNPTPPQGGMFKVDRFVAIESVPEAMAHVVRYWDKAGTEAEPGKGSKAAWTVGVKMARCSNGMLAVLDVRRGRWSSEVREQVIRSTAEADGQEVEVWVEQEPGSGGKESAQATIRSLVGYRIHAERPTGSKVHRADPYSVQVNNGNVMLLRGDWNRDFIDEHRYFPYSRFKDQVDAASGAMGKLAGKRRAGVLLSSRRAYAI